MYRITEQDIIDLYEHYKDSALKREESGEIDDALDCLETAGMIACQYWLNYSDSEIEECIQRIAKSESRVVENIDNARERIVFYETYSNTDALTLQYLDALAKRDADILYLTRVGGNSKKHLPSLELFADSRTNIAIRVLPQTISRIETVRLLAEEIVNFHPNKVFAEMVMFDVEGATTFYALSGCEKFFVETSDHTFWLGANAFDYFLSFRSLGYNIATKYRGIKPAKVLVQPYYPILAGRAYQGVPSNNEASVRVFSGSRLDKIYSKDDRFFKIVASILHSGELVEYYFAGASGQGRAARTAPFERLCSKYGLGENFHPIGYRDDLTVLLDHMDIYVGTYPLAGGLMSQIAAAKGVPIIQFATKGLADSIGELLPKADPAEFVFVEDEQGFAEEIAKLIESKDYRIERGLKAKESLITKDEFVSQANNLINMKKSSYVVRDYDVDISRLRDNWLYVENELTHDLNRIVVRSGYTRRREPLRYTYHAILFVLSTDKRWLIKKVIERFSIAH